MFSAKAGDWLQFFGALLAAGTGVALWFAERRRISVNASNDEMRRSHEFRKVIRVALLDLASQTNPIIIFRDTSIGNCQQILRGETGLNDDHQQHLELLREIQQASIHLKISPAPILDLSKSHVRHMTFEQSSATAAVFSGARKVAHLLDRVALPTNGVNEAVDALNMVGEAADRLLAQIDSLEAELRTVPHDVIASPTER